MSDARMLLHLPPQALNWTPHALNGGMMLCKFSAFLKYGNEAR
jgi:hypothetical protein